MPFILIGIAIVSIVVWAFSQNSGDVQPESLPKNPRGPFREDDRVMIIGLPMSGKTTLAAKLTKQCPRVLYFDPMDDYGPKAGARRVSAQELIDDPSMLKVPSFRVAAIPDAGLEAEQLERIVLIARAAGDLVLVLDEVGDYKRFAELELVKLARNGRHDGIVSVYVSQMAVDIPKGVRRLATRVYSFRQFHKDDIKALEEIYGESFAQSVSQAREHEVIEWTLPGLSPLEAFSAGNRSQTKNQTRRQQSGTEPI